MRKFLKRSFFKKVFIFLFISLYILFPPIYTIGTTLENSVLGDVRVDEDILDEGISDPEWIAKPLYAYKDGVYTVDVVEERQYIYPDNQDVRVMFTSISEEGDLTIEKITLSEDEKIELNTVDDYAWEITSSMSNGSFEYNLTLPNTSGSTDIELKYTEDGEVYESIDDVVVNEGVIYLEGLDHFTVFVVVNVGNDKDNPIHCDRVHTGADKCFDSITEALSETNDGDIIYVEKGTYEEDIQINKSITLVGKGSDRTILKSKINVTANDVVIKKFAIQGKLTVRSCEHVEILNNHFGESTEDGGLELMDPGPKSKQYGNHTVKNNVFNNVNKEGHYAVVRLQQTNNNTIVNNQIVSNTTSYGGISLLNSSNNRIERNTIIDNNEAPFIEYRSETSYGIELSNSKENILKGNTISKHNTGIGFNGTTSGNKVRNNVIENNWHGIRFGQNTNTDNTIIGNQIRFNEIIPRSVPEKKADGSSGISFHIDINNVSTKIKYNNFEGNKGLAIRYNGENEFNTSENWWGHISGPSRDGLSGLGDKISPNVVANEWLCEPYETEWVSEGGVCKLQTPEQIGFNVNDGTPIDTSPTKYECTEGYTNTNGVSIHWNNIVNGNTNIFYERQYSRNGINWTEDEVYTNPYTNYKSFGFGEVPHYSRVRAFYETKEGRKYSEWSNECSITYDNTPPQIPSGLYYRDLKNDKDVQCGGYSNTHNMTIDWDNIVNDPSFSHFEYSSFDAPNGSPGLVEKNMGTSFFDCSWWDIPSEGEYGVEIRAVDKAGNKSDWTNRCTINIDWAPPKSDYSSNLSNSFHNSSILLEGKTEDENNVDYTGLYYSEAGENDWKLLTKTGNSEKSSLFNWSYDWVPEEEGVYDIYASGTDLAGNIEESAFIYSLTYDITPPSISLLNLINGVLEKIETDCGLSGLDTIQVRIGDGKWKEYIEGMNLNDLVNREPGTYTVYIKVTDKAGNIKERKATFSIPAPAPTTLEEVLGAIAGPLSPQPAHATVLGTTNRIYAQDSNAQEEVAEDIEEEIEEYKEIEEFEKNDVQREIEPTILEEESNEEEESNGIKWWIYLLILLPLLFIFFLLWKRRKDEEEDNRA